MLRILLKLRIETIARRHLQHLEHKLRDLLLAAQALVNAWNLHS